MGKSVMEEMLAFMEKKEKLQKERAEWKRQQAAKEARKRKKALQNQEKKKEEKSKQKTRPKPLIEDIDWKKVKQLRKKKTSWKEIACRMGISQYKLYREGKNKGIK